MKIALFSIGLAITFMALAYADHNQYLFDQANQLYQQEQYQQAIDKYLEIRNSGYESWQLYYNLGNAYYKTRDLGRAILNYERALKLNPKNEDIKFNLDLANLQVVDKIVVPPQFFMFKILSDLKNLWSLKTLTFLTLFFYLLLTGLIIMRILLRDIRVQRIVRIAWIPALILLLLVGTIFIVRIHEDSTLHYAIVLVDKIDVLSSPDDQGTELFALHRGVKLQIEASRADWAKIRLADGKIGWIKKQAFEII
ncbi:MAG: tetratricopeptide repeat protein [candidate division KSB1 bacterium]|nr:tetratricopeptide repeat protein [candidate division KSB1 bacterium]